MAEQSAEFPQEGPITRRIRQAQAPVFPVKVETVETDQAKQKPPETSDEATLRKIEAERKIRALQKSQGLPPAETEKRP